jgi:oligopeptide transport system ATP-binding protein
MSATAMSHPQHGHVTDTLLEVEDLNIWLPGPAGALEIVEGIHLSVRPGEVLGIAGESGSGKTITALALMGMLPKGGVARGRARLGDIELLELSRRAWQRVRGVEIAMVFQDPMTSLHPMLNIERQLTEHIRDHGLSDRRGARKRALELLSQVRIPDPAAALSAYPHQLSGGMRQRVALAMALACEPKLLIADEPTTALDVTVQAGILQLLRDLCTDTSMAAILVTHDLGVMSAVADTLAVFYAGRVVEYGALGQLLQHPRHPYTRGLLDALPGEHGGAAAEAFEEIPGAPPQPGDRPEGCSFHPRCRFAQPSCREREPELVGQEDGRWLACPVDPLEQP